ncbi:dual-specificity RNA methyltransferase RlmN [Desulfosarcina widdelii]|uniref:Dual-specificity RNA methyltransferase RlmN n=1 Tax=Desulfosarcina widdelii TaxID=947919 RepID=A0A5K7ZAD6_9BACT|nr:23S rRNA (adenine(2503)-C(2))-methyltransferase RlmN [Desulfosarcina widdelii]BBO76661.1 dual-specificity RNA methyltransferase RlmN [Desulfosarcina widdelii]
MNTDKRQRPLSDIFSLTHDQFVDAAFHRYGKKAYYSSPVYRQIMKNGQTDLSALDSADRIPQWLDQTEADLGPMRGKVVKRIDDGGVAKFVTRLDDGLDIESVIIPMHRRHTLCVSSQVGCRMGCRFCRTGKMGLIRNLDAGEIVEQIFTARHGLGVDVRNVVFMGMGEPLDNLDNVVQAIRVLEDQRGMDIARRYITVSTAGVVDGIDRLARLDDGPVNLAISLNAPNDEVRSRIMPVNRNNPMAALKASLLRYPLRKKSACFIEYVLIQGINDRPEHARALARYLKPLPVKLNLIAYNPTPDSGLQAPSPDAVEQFRSWLVAEKVFVRQRGEKGGAIMAACGQLGGKQRLSVPEHCR